MTNTTIALFIIGGLIIFIIGYVGGYVFGRNNRKDIDKTIDNYMNDNIETQKQLGKVMDAMDGFLNTLCDSHINHVGFCEEEFMKLDQAIKELKEKNEVRNNYAIFDDD